jgi:hypothetical protein
MNDRIKIVGPHPWTGLFGRLVDNRPQGTYPQHLRVRLEDGQPCPHGHIVLVNHAHVQFVSRSSGCIR